MSLFGKPLIAYSIEAAQRSGVVDRVVVSTDDEEIAAVSRRLGAEVPFLRPSELAGDRANVLDALQHALQYLDETEGYRSDYVLTLQPTSPLIEPEQIKRGLALASEKQAESVVSVVELPHRHHPHNIRETRGDETTRFWMEPEHYRVLNRQERPAFYAYGNLYVSSWELLALRRLLEGERNYSFLIDPLTALDIDGPEDLALIELIMEARARRAS